MTIAVNGEALCRPLPRSAALHDHAGHERAPACVAITPTPTPTPPTPAPAAGPGVRVRAEKGTRMWRLHRNRTNWLEQTVCPSYCPIGIEIQQSNGINATWRYRNGGGGELGVVDMHILMSILGALGVLLLILWRMQQAAHVARGLGDAAADARGLFRRWQWRRKAQVNPLDLISDPREAATAMMVAVAQADGLLSEVERDVIINQIRSAFKATERQADELLAAARWHIREGVDLAEIFRRLAPLIVRQCTEAEQRQLISMLDAVANADGQPDPIIAQDVARLGQAFRG